MALRSRTKRVTINVKPAPNVGLTLFVAADSLPSDWARLVLAEKEVDSAAIQTIRPGEVDEDFLLLNPTQALPTLADREGVIQSARVIVEYLDERYPHPSMMPLSPSGRARVRMTLHRIDNELFPLAAKMRGTGTEASGARTALVQGLLDGARFFPSRGYFLGSEYTLADAAWAVLFRRLLASSVTIPRDASSMIAYAERLFARPAFLRCFNSTPKSVSRKA